MIIEEKEFKKVCNVDDLPEGFGRRYMIEEVDVAIFKVNGEIFALSNICPHQKSAIIYNGFLEDGKVVCPAHGWEFNLNDGCQHGGRRGLDSYEIKIINNEVYVKVFTRELDW